MLDFNDGAVYRYRMTLLDGIDDLDITAQAVELLEGIGHRESETQYMLQPADDVEAGYIHNLTRYTHAYVYNPARAS